MFRLFLSLAAAAFLSVGGNIGVTYADPEAVAQVPTETPAILNLAPAQQQATAESSTGGATATRTPTPVGSALLEAIEFANVRAEPSTESAQLGTIRVGETYNVIARYVSWIQFEYPSSPTGRGWVFGELVNLTGSVDTIPEINPFSADQQLDANSIAGTATQGILTQTPGGVLTATAASQLLSQPGASTPTSPGVPEILPTFTFPPGMIAIAPTSGALASPESTQDTPQGVVPTSTNSFPPMMPIIILGALGLLGLAISALRRG